MNFYHNQEESLKAAYAMSRKERIEALSHGVVDNDILSVEIESRTGIGQKFVEDVLIYELLHGIKNGEINIRKLAREIGDATESPEEETENIKYVDMLAAFQILVTEDNIYWECGINED